MTAETRAADSPDTSGRAISSLAILKVNYDRGHSYVENFVPFVSHCLATEQPKVVSLPELQRTLVEEFGLELPQAPLRTVLKRLQQEGQVRETAGVLEPVPEELSGKRLDSQRADVLRQYEALAAALLKFAEEGYDRSWNREHAATALSAYLDTHSAAVLAAAIEGRPIHGARDAFPDPDLFLVHRFVAEVFESDPESFSFLETVVKGKMLSDALFFTDLAEPPTSVEGLEVYFDGPILLQLLGLAGPELAAPHIELVTMLKRQGAHPRCFEHSVEEVQRIIDAAAEKAGRSTPERFYGDAVAYLTRAGYSKSDLLLRSQRVANDLLRLGVQPVPTPPPDVALTTDEEKLERLLQDRMRYTNREALLRDLDSLTAIHRLREGRQFRDLAKSRAIFVTGNVGVFKIGLTFFETRRAGKAVPHGVLTRPFTTLVWLGEPLAAPALAKERIIADAFAALNPPDKLWEALNAEIERLTAEGEVSEEDIAFLRLAPEAQEALMDETLGDARAFVEGTGHQVLARARENASADAERRATEEANERRRSERDLAKVRERIEEGSRWLGRVAAWGLFVAIIPALILGLVFGPLGPLKDAWTPLPVLLQGLFTALAVGFTLFSAILGISLKSVSGWVARRCEKLALRALSRALLPDRDAP